MTLERGLCAQRWAQELSDLSFRGHTQPWRDVYFIKRELGEPLSCRHRHANQTFGWPSSAWVNALNSKRLDHPHMRDYYSDGVPWGFLDDVRGWCTVAKGSGSVSRGVDCMYCNEWWNGWKVPCWTMRMRTAAVWLLDCGELLLRLSELAPFLFGTYWWLYLGIEYCL